MSEPSTTGSASTPSTPPLVAAPSNGAPEIEMPVGLTPRADYADGPSSPGLLNTTLEYEYSIGSSYRLMFDGDFGVTFHLLNDGSEPRGPLPCRVREIRPSMYLVHWLVKQFSIHVALVVDLEMSRLSVAGAMPPGQWEFFDQATDVKVTRTA